MTTRSRHLDCALSILTLVVICSGSTTSLKAASVEPNIVIFLADDLGYNDLTCYRAANATDVEGGPACQTPVIDTLAAQGMRFTDFYTGAPTCSPSRCALLTGRNATRVGMYNWMPGGSPMHLRTSEVTIAEALKSAGYTSAFFGKWHISGSDKILDKHPGTQGFDYAFWTYQNAYPTHASPMNFRRFTSDSGENVRVGRVSKPGTVRYSCEVIADEAIGWLEENRDHSQPFFISLFFHEPHKKCAAPEELVERHKHTEFPAYYACIENMDLAIGRMLKRIESMGVADNTMVMLLSDNGALGERSYSNAPLRGAKAFLFDGGVRSPFIIKWPARIRAGTVTSALASSTDIMPTLCAITEASLPKDCTIDGVDISDVLTGKAATVERDNGVFFFRYTHNPICMLRVGDFCLLGYTRKYSSIEVPPAHGSELVRGWGFGPEHMNSLVDLVPVEFELYDMKNDTKQEHDIASKKPEFVAKMKAQMLKLRREMVAEGSIWEFPRKNPRKKGLPRSGRPAIRRRPSRVPSSHKSERLL